ncbi:MAG: hypothetical protein C0467_08945 [Planctomycetaceae bacterium]|nr:hypothetical protein [Planctomycetaceae bacterium]
MTTPPNDPAMTDRLWVGYHPRALAPLVTLITFVSLLVWTGQWYLDDISNLAAELGAWATFAIAWGVWPALLLVFLYRTVTFTYRLTDRAVITDFGPLCYPVEPIPLALVGSVEVGGGWLTRLLGVGFVEVRAGERVLRLKGVRNPESFAGEVRAAKMAAQQMN